MLNLQWDEAAGIAELRFSRPPLNFASTALLREIADALATVDENPALNCSLLASEGKVFCAGADLAGDESMGGDDGIAEIARFYEQAGRIFARRKPLIAAIQGAAVGAGLGLALSADFRVAGPNARFSSNFVRLGFHPGFALSVTLPRTVGEQVALRMMMTAERMKPEEALEVKLVDRMSEAGRELDAAREFAMAISANAPLALRSVRTTMLGDLPASAISAMRKELVQQAALKVTDDYKEGVTSTFERREPRFVGR